MSGLTLESTVQLNDGNTIPALGYGVFEMKDPGACEKGIIAALKTGYRHIDTAFVYGNEESVGNAVADSDTPRDDIFITTKNVFDHDEDRIREVFQESLDKLQTDYVDLFLIHWPLNDEGLPGAWDTLVRMKEEGLCRSVGVSNITVKRFEVLFRKNQTLPAVNQIELHVYRQQSELVTYCKDKGIILEAYSPLARAKKLDDPGEALTTAAEKYGKTVPQVMIRFLLQQDIVTLVKSQTHSRIKENADVFDFELSKDEMSALKGLDEDLNMLGWTPEDFY